MTRQVSLLVLDNVIFFLLVFRPGQIEFLAFGLKFVSCFVGSSYFFALIMIYA